MPGHCRSVGVDCSHALGRVALLLACCAGMAACSGPGRPAQLVPAASSASAAETEFARFDRLVSAQALFPDPAWRSLYRTLPPLTENGQRSYAFQLQLLPGMDSTRHFQLVTVTWARGGQLLKAQASAAGLSGTGGPGGSFIDAVAQTEDRAWDVRVSLGNRLPASVSVPSFDVAAAAATMVRLYQAR